LGEFKRCRCCIPLRYGLLISGYFKLIVSVAVLVPVTYLLVQSVIELQWRTYEDNITPLTMLTITALVTLCDIAMNIVFLIGNHKKNARLLRVFYSYSIGLLVLYVVALVMLVAQFDKNNYVYMVPLIGVIYQTTPLEFESMFEIVNICFQVYFILITKSEIAKLKNNCQFRFTNKDNEAQCTMYDVGVNEAKANEAQCTMYDVGVNKTNGTCIIKQ